MFIILREGGRLNDYYIARFEQIYDSFCFSLKIFGGSVVDRKWVKKEAIQKCDATLQEAFKNKESGILTARKRIETIHRIEVTYERWVGED